MIGKKSAVGGLAALTLFDIVAAQAQPLPSWTGTYFGAHLGYRWGNANLNGPVPGLPTTTAFVPGTPGTAGTPGTPGTPATTICTETFDGFCIATETIPGTPAIPAVPGIPAVADILGTVAFGPLSSQNFHFSPNGGVFGFLAGYNYQITAIWLIGIEGDVSWGHGSDTQTFRFQDPITGVINGQFFNLETQWSTSLRGRFGYVAGNWLFYGTGGPILLRTSVTGGGLSCGVFAGCVTGFTETFTSGFGATKTLFGWTFGGGIETLLRDNWLLRVEYLYADFGHVNFGNMAINSFYSDTVFCFCSGSSTSTGNVSGTLTTQTLRFAVSKLFP